MRGTALERFEYYSITVPSGCRIWLGEVGGNNDYGRLWVAGKKVGAHRFAYETFSGKKIPSGMDVHHQCNTPPCVEWRHLEPMPNYENHALRRKFTCKKHQCRKKHRGGRLVCLKCCNERTVKWRTKLKAKRKG